MLSKNEIKDIRGLKDKKNRQESGLFIVEGGKSVLELIQSNFEIVNLLLTEEFLKENEKVILDSGLPFEIMRQSEIEGIGTFESNSAGLAIAKQKPNIETKIEVGEIVLALDEVKDPGNLGTIIRIADWYGIKKIIASTNTTDFYNSKTIAATMGSFTRINVYYTDLKDFLPKTELPILGAFMTGENVHTLKFPIGGILLMGNESNGIHADLENIITQRVNIPRFGGAESLNVSIATAVILDNWKRN
ncbi:MAG: RNA methyltransferase [bacterium]